MTTTVQLDTVFDTAQTMDVVPAGTVFAVDREKRVIRGLAVPFGVAAVKDGKRFTFSKGTVRPYGEALSSVKLWVSHDKATATGVLFEAEDTDEGYAVALRVARGAAGDHALSMAEDGVWDGLSIGPNEGAKYRLAQDGTYEAVDIPIHEISLTPAPVFGGARVRSVTFDIEENQMKCTKCGVVHGAGITDCKPEDVTAFEASLGAGTAFDMTGLVEPLTVALTEAFGHLVPDPQGHAEKISATDGLEVNEPSPYRFDGLPGEHSFAMDLRASQSGDSAAKQRLDEFVEELAAFAVTTTNTASLNPVKNRPDLYVPNLQFSRPLWELVTTGVLDDITAFTIPKFASASGLVGTHTQGVEPTPGAFAATVQTVTPTAKSGKIEINREVWDQAGNPKADGIIWAEMLGGWYESLETMIATALAAVGTAELNLASAVDAALVKALTGYFAGLQFVRGGNRFTAFASDGNLFPALVNAADTAGRPLLPILGAQNAQGQTSGGFDRVQVGNQTVRAAWALGTGNDKKSYNFVPSSVWAWASTPKRFEFEYQVKSIDMAIWGYGAAAVTRDSDVKPVDYTTADA